MTFRSLTLRSMKLLKSDALVSCRQQSFNTVIISGRVLFKSLFRQVMKEQTSIMGLRRHKDYHYIYFNNYIIMIDFIFRLLMNFSELHTRLTKHYGAKNIILVDDVDESNLPYNWRLYIPKNKAYANVEEIEQMCIHKLKSLRRLLKVDEMEDFDRWERYLSTKYPQHYDFCLRDKHTHITNEKLKHKETMEFLHFVMLSQMRLTKKELLTCWNFMLKQLRSNKIQNLQIIEFDTSSEHNGLFKSFDYNIIKDYNSARTLMVTDMFFYMPNVYFTKLNGKLYYPYLVKRYRETDVSVSDYILLERRKHKKVPSMLDIYDVCESECQDRILDINSAYTFVLFENMRDVYVERKLDVLMPERIEEQEFAWISKSTYTQIIPKVTEEFNKICTIKIND